MSDKEFLESRGWVKIDAVYNRYWVWRQPKTGALFTLHDALDVQHGLDKEKGIKKDA